MKALYQYLKSTITGLLRFGIAYAVFLYVADFSRIQSAVLSILALCAVDAYRLAIKTATNQQPQFEPFWVWVQPNWYSICHDFGLAAGEKWAELQEKCETASAEYSVMRNGLNFTMLSPTLFYSNDYHIFRGELDFNESIDEMRDWGGLVPFSPQFYVKRRLGGEKKNLSIIEFGLVTRESLKKSNHHLDDAANIPIAQLPESVFFGYTHPDDYNFETMAKIEEETQRQLTKFGWTQRERDQYDCGNRPEEVKHKYIRVEYRGIS